MEYLSLVYYRQLPSKPGIYIFRKANNSVLYVGKAKNLKDRVSSYFTSPSNLLPKTKLLVAQIKKISFITVESEFESLLLEAVYIKKYLPKYNIRLTDGKAYPLIRITKKDKYPAVLTARRQDDKKSIYFGPYPNSTSMRMVLKYLRKLFPYQSTQNHSKTFCFYYHIGLCPCASAVGTIGARSKYKKSINHIVDFLNGKTQKVLNDLVNERNNLAKLEKFEEAAEVQKQIDSINYITHPFHKPFEYESNPNLREELRMNEVIDLKNILNKNGVKLNLPLRIECYDNSNFQGKNPTSSMVVLTQGEIDKSQYRKFKIRKVKGPNDFETMKEVLTRRMKHYEWQMPDLIIVDGGKGQVSVANEALRQFSILNSQFSTPPIIGLAKRNEVIITSDFKEISLPKSSPALKLIMRIRDEAHRFAISYHRKLRSKALIEE